MVDRSLDLQYRTVLGLDVQSIEESFCDDFERSYRVSRYSTTVYWSYALHGAKDPIQRTYYIIITFSAFTPKKSQKESLPSSQYLHDSMVASPPPHSGRTDGKKHVHYCDVGIDLHPSQVYVLFQSAPQ